MTFPTPLSFRYHLPLNIPVLSKRVISSSFLHFSVFFSKILSGNPKFFPVGNEKNWAQVMARLFQAYAITQAHFFYFCWGDEITHPVCNFVTPLYGSLAQFFTFFKGQKQEKFDLKKNAFSQDEFRTLYLHILITNTCFNHIYYKYCVFEWVKKCFEKIYYNDIFFSF